VYRSVADAASSGRDEGEEEDAVAEGALKGVGCVVVFGLVAAEELEALLADGV